MERGQSLLWALARPTTKIALTYLSTLCFSHLGILYVVEDGKRPIRQKVRWNNAIGQSGDGGPRVTIADGREFLSLATGEFTARLEVP